MSDDSFTYYQYHSAEFPLDKMWMAEFVYDVIEDEQKHGYAEVDELAFIKDENKLEVKWRTKHSLPDELCWRCENLCRKLGCCKDAIGTEYQYTFPASECDNFVEKKE